MMHRERMPPSVVARVAMNRRRSKVSPRSTDVEQWQSGNERRMKDANGNHGQTDQSLHHTCDKQ